MSEEATANDRQLMVPNSVEQENPLIINATADGGSGATDIKTVDSNSTPGSLTNTHNLPTDMIGRKSSDSMAKNRASLGKKSEDIEMDEE